MRLDVSGIRECNITIAWSFFLLALTGCMVGPNYTPPDIAIGDDWITDALPEEEISKTWWEVFQDPLLNQYIAQAEECNYDIMTAEAHILRARSMRQVAASSLFPQVTADVNGTKTYFSKNGPVFAIGPAAGNAAVTSSPLTGLPFAIQVPQIQNLFNALFDATWELDLFGKTRRSIEQADALIGSAIEQKNDMLISVFAEVSRTYMELRSFQTRQQLLEENISLYQEEAEIIRKRFEAGYSNRTDVENAESQLSQAQAMLPRVISEIYRSIYTLSILTGKMPEILVDELSPKQSLPKAPENIALGLRSDLLRRRPDVRRAERDLAAATASIGVAVGSFFPTISLLGMGGFQSLQLPELLNWGSKTWAYGTDVSMPVYQGGKLVGNLHFTQAMQAAAAYTYQQVVLSAVQNAESSLVAYKQGQVASMRLCEVVSREENRMEISKQRFDKGLVNKLDLIDSQKQLVQARLSSTESDTALLLAVVAMYKALGGGWERNLE